MEYSDYELKKIYMYYNCDRYLKTTDLELINYQLPSILVPYDKVLRSLLEEPLLITQSCNCHWNVYLVGRMMNLLEELIKTNKISLIDDKFINMVYKYKVSLKDTIRGIRMLLLMKESNDRNNYVKCANYFQKNNELFKGIFRNIFRYFPGKNIDNECLNIWNNIYKILKDVKQYDNREVAYLIMAYFYCQQDRINYSLKKLEEVEIEYINNSSLFFEETELNGIKVWNSLNFSDRFLKYFENYIESKVFEDKNKFKVLVR